MKITVIGSHLCPDTLSALNRLSVADAEIDYKDILSCHGDLRTYLKLRDHHQAYEGIRGTDRLGVPCFVTEDGTVTLDIEEILK